MTVRITALTDADPGGRLAWLAADAEGSPLGAAYLQLFTGAGQLHLAELDVNVHPAERRAGIGTRLLAEAVAAARRQERRVLLAQAGSDSGGAAFLAARGFEVALTLLFTRLPSADADAATLAAEIETPHPGYRLATWEGMVPEELAGSFVASRRAMDDMPMGAVDFGRVIWDLDRVRRAVGAIVDRGDVLHTVAAVEEASGAVVAFTELVLPGGGSGDAQHYGTGVLPEHRGRGLARWMKAASIAYARERHPGVAGLLADTADDNPAMRRVNEALGYRPTHTRHQYQLKL
ncbi:GNAT family N-acetyltransferase [Kitasatospora sp. NPDC002227]|uniref:GNAT family N-acetyltransferase n=1 Tax=Kitasatospora sp. NPDC002227 TaxID=3154773 RepID=UPI003321E88D